jgi:hypothetical protein
MLLGYFTDTNIKTHLFIAEMGLLQLMAWMWQNSAKNCPQLPS